MGPKSFSPRITWTTAVRLAAACFVFGPAAAASDTVSNDPEFFGVAIYPGVFLRSEVEIEDPEPATAYLRIPELPALVAKAGVGVRIGGLTLRLGPRLYDEKVAVRNLDLDAFYRLGEVEVGFSIENLVNRRATTPELFVRFAF